MKILFFARHFSYLRNFESAIEALAARGHRIHLSADRLEGLGGEALVARLVAAHPSVTMGWTPNREGQPWFQLGRALRLGLDYLRFLDPLYGDAPRLRSRAAERAPALVVRAAGLPGLRSARGRQRLAATLGWLERGIPRDAALDACIREHDPDLVLLTPFIELGTPQMDHLLSARAQGRRTVICVGSWDHLSTKALLRELPDAITVWNGIQQREATELHGVPGDRVVVTGAQCYDQWFGRGPSRDRQAFCDRVGLRADRPFILYVCSSLFRGTGSEARFVEKWIQQIRSSDDPVLREAGLLVRPHPARPDEWQTSDLSQYRNLALFGAHPVDEAAKNDYFDSMYHSAAVVGLNTSAFLEAGIVGRPVHTILLPDLSPTNQEGTLHFRYLLEGNGGLLYAARSFEEHAAQLGAALRAPSTVDPRNAGFVESFIRPFGLDAPATPRFVEAIEGVASRPVAVVAEAGSTARVLARAALAPWLVLAWLRVSSLDARTTLRARIARRVELTVRRFWGTIRNVAIARLKAEDPREAIARSGAGRLTPKVGKPRDPAKSLMFPHVPEAAEARQTVTVFGKSDRPIIVGPWLTETGFELLYWIPFLRWAKAYGNLAAERLIVVSRGGAAPWYRQISGEYEDILSFYTPDEFRSRNDERVQKQGGRFKHTEVTTFDREVIAKVCARRGIAEHKLLHPSLMYQLFNLFWRQMAPLTIVEGFSSFERLPSVDASDLARHLPEQYVAVKFYANAALPDTAENRAFTTAVLDTLAETTDVVLLNTGHRFDDHADFSPLARGRVHTIEHLMEPGNNLEVQTKVISRASAFVGTYGGFSYLAPLCGIDTVTFYSHPTGFRFDHLDVAKRVFSSVGGGSFVPLDVRDTPVTRLVMGGSLAPLSVTTR